MSKELIKKIEEYVETVICGFETGMYKMITDNYKYRVELLANPEQPFISIYRDLHEKYYADTFNSIVKRDDAFVNETFDRFKSITNHSKKSILTVLANLIVSVHFNLNRTNLKTKRMNPYLTSIKKEITKTLAVIKLNKLFEEECDLTPDSDLKILPPGEKFIQISMRFKSNGIMKPINSFSDGK